MDPDGRGGAMGVSVRREPVEDGRAVVIWIYGDLDLSTRDTVGPALCQAVAEGGPATVLVDLTGTRFLDATGIGVLMRAYTRARAMGVDLRVRGARGLVAAVLRVTRADEVLCRGSNAESDPAFSPL
jgi:anti-anti-sigma factor